jgi:sporulation protein YlmC with PRC-barrel domain
MAELAADDEGKPVYDEEGTEVGTVDEVTDEGFYLRFGEGVEVNWGGDTGQDRYPVGRDSVEQVDDDGVRLSGDMR